MQIWIDLDKVEQIPFLKALTNELNERGHKVFLTALDLKDLKARLNGENIYAKYVGRTFSIFGLLKEQFIILRSVLLSNYIKEKNINVALSLGSKPMIYACSDLNLQIMLLIDDYKEKISWVHFAFDKSLFIIPSTISEQQLLESKIDPKRCAKYNGHIRKDDQNPNLKLIKEIVNQIQPLSTYQDTKA